MADTDADDRTRMQVRVLRLLAALLNAGIEDLAIADFHAFAFFAEILAPVWGERSPIGDVLKEDGGPHYPALQRELDRLVGMGVVRISRLTSADRGGRWRLDATFALNTRVADQVLVLVDSMPDEDAAATEFLNQLAFGFADIPTEQRDDAALVDAAWSDPGAAPGRLIDFTGTLPGGRPKPNYSSQAAKHFQSHAPRGVHLSPAEQTSLYMSLMRRRAGG